MHNLEKLSKLTGTGSGHQFSSENVTLLNIFVSNYWYRLPWKKNFWNWYRNALLYCSAFQLILLGNHHVRIVLVDKFKEENINFLNYVNIWHNFPKVENCELVSLCRACRTWGTARAGLYTRPTSPTTSGTTVYYTP